MIEFYEAVRDMDPGHTHYALTVLDGPQAGEKALVSNQSMTFCTAPDGFLASHRDAVCALTESGIHPVEDTRVFAERLGYEKKLVVCGSGHVAVPVIRLGKALGFQVTVIEERPMFANDARNAGADTVYCETFEQGLSHVPGDLDTSFVIVTRGHQYDKDCIRLIGAKPYGYLGMLGSKRRVALVKQTLAEEGVPQKALDDLHAPIGLPIGAETPEEIAVSILAEIIQVKNEERRSYGYPSKLLEELLKADGSRKAVATIVAKRGSAPRNVGTKMIVLPGGQLIGTIGGGCLEAGVVAYAEELLEADHPVSHLCHLDLADDAAAEDGMVCGGNVDVFLELA